MIILEQANPSMCSRTKY